VGALAVAIALAPILAVLVLLVLALRKLWPPRLAEEPWTNPSSGPGPIGVREPRRTARYEGTADASLVESFDDDGSEVVQIASRSHEMGGKAKKRTTSVITQAEDIDDHRRHVLLVCLSSPTKGHSAGSACRGRSPPPATMITTSTLAATGPGPMPLAERWSLQAGGRQSFSTSISNCCENRHQAAHEENDQPTIAPEGPSPSDSDCDQQDRASEAQPPSARR